jgi:light-regulated signal transduction histidine kinase (bacteriophytochrome)
MDQLVEDLLRLSRISRAEVQLQDIDLSTMAEEILADLKLSEPNRSVETTVQPQLRARGDLRLVRLIVDNLLRNAWKFTSKRNGATISFEGPAGTRDTFCVRDNGVGFDMAYAGRLFGVFQRLHSANEFPGSGVGLAIVQRVVNRHGGRVWADAKPNEGATFCFTLPVPGGS